MRVYHAKHPTFGLMDDESGQSWPQDYEFVAELDGQQLTPEHALERAFTATQDNWSPDGRRSTAPGDVVALDSGELYRCEMAGWTPIGRTWESKTAPPPSGKPLKRTV